MSEEIDLHPIPRTRKDEPRGDVIFVPGLVGDPFATWWHDSDEVKDCWPFWLAEEAPEVQVYCLRYQADWTHWFGGEGMPLFDRAKSVLNLMSAFELGARPIVFICHSLGGLVVKQSLRQAADPGADPVWQAIGEQTRGVVFIATPHAGADLARIAKRLAMVTKTTPVIPDLTAHASALRGLNEWFRGYAKGTGLRVLCYYETRTTGTKRVPLVGRWLGRVLSAGIKVVEEADADPGLVGVVPVPLDADHFGTCKPDRRDRPLCKDVIRLVRVVLDENVAVSEKTASAEAKATGPKGPTHLPADLPDFQGRQEQIKQLKSILTGGGPAAVTAICGMGGVGKSALALHVAHQLADAAPDERVFIDLGGTSPQPLNPLAAMITVIQALHPQAQAPTELGPALSLYRSCLDGKRVLLLLDNAANSAQVAPLVEWRAPTTLVIVTSRQAIAAPGLTNLGLDMMELGEARDLLRVALSERTATEAELDALSEGCGRLPLALRVAGTFLALSRDWSVAEYIAALADQRQRLAWLKIEDDARLDVHAVLGFSARRLAEDKPELFARWQRLAVFATSFDRIAAAAIWSIEESQARKGLGELLRRSMLMYDETDGRYRLHDLMRDVAQLPLEGEDQATVAGRLEEAAARHAQHYCRVLAKADKLYLEGSENVLAGLALYDLEQRNIAAGQAWAAERIEIRDDAARLTAEYANAGVYVLNLRLPPRELIRWLEAQLKVYRRLGDRRGEGNALGNLGLAYADLDEPRRAIEYYEQSLKIAQEIGDRWGEGNALGNLGLAYAALGELRQAIEHYEQDLVIAREIGDRRGEGAVLGNLGLAYAGLGEVRQAVQYYEQQLAVVREIGDRRLEGEALGNLGRAYAALDETLRAIEHHERQLAITREIGDRRGEGDALGGLGRVYADLDEPRRAIEHFEQHLAITREIGDRRGEGSALGNLGNVYAALGEPRRAMKYYEQHLAIARAIGDRRGEGNSLYGSALAFDDLGDRDEAVRRMEEVVRIYEQIENPWRENARAKLAEWRGKGIG